MTVLGVEECSRMWKNICSHKEWKKSLVSLMWFLFSKGYL